MKAARFSGRIFFFVVILTAHVSCTIEKDDPDVLPPFPESEEEIKASIEMMEEIGEGISTIIDQHKVSGSDVDADAIAKEIQKLDNVKSACPNEYGTSVIVQQKDGVYFNVLLVDRSVSEEPVSKSQWEGLNDIITKSRDVSVPQGKSALILAPFQSEFQDNLSEIKNYLGGVGFDVKVFQNKEADLSKFRGDFLDNFDLLYIATHGMADGMTAGGSAVESYMCTATLTSENYKPFFSDQIIVLYDKGYYYGVDTRTLDGAKFDNSFVLLGVCNSSSFASKFHEAGASLAVGYTETIDNYLAVWYYLNLFRNLSYGRSFHSAHSLLLDVLYDNNASNEVSFLENKSRVYGDSKNCYLYDPTPTELHSNVNGNSVKLEWDAHPSNGGLRYIVHVGNESYEVPQCVGSHGEFVYSPNACGTHYWHVTAVNASGETFDSVEDSFNVESVISIKTGAPAFVGTGSAEIPFSISDCGDVYGTGIIYSTTNSNPTVGHADDYGLLGGNLIDSMILHELEPNTTYYARAFVCIEENVNYQYGNVVQFTTKEVSYSKDWVNLGLSVKWATCNLGTSSPEDAGAYYRWGETVPVNKRNNYKWSGKNGFTKYNSSDNKTRLDPADDAAYVNLGGKWRTPTSDELYELRNSCTWTRATKNGVKGCQVTGPNGKSIFIPISRGTSNYWDVEFMSSNLNYSEERIQALSFDYWKEYVYYLSTYRDWGIPVRPVYDDKDSQPSIGLSPSELNYGEVAVGRSKGNEAGRVRITNSGASDLIITSIDCPSGFSHSPNLSFPHTIAPGDTWTVTFAFRPTETKKYSGYIIFNSNASNGSTARVRATGTGI